MSLYVFLFVSCNIWQGSSAFIYVHVYDKDRVCSRSVLRGIPGETGRGSTCLAASDMALVKPTAGLSRILGPVIDGGRAWCSVQEKRSYRILLSAPTAWQLLPQATEKTSRHTHTLDNPLCVNVQCLCRCVCVWVGDYVSYIAIFVASRPADVFTFLSLFLKLVYL